MFIKLTDPSYVSKKLVFTIQDLFSQGNEVEYDSNDESEQVPNFSAVEFNKDMSYASIEYSGSFSGPIELDISYLTPGGFLRQDYSNAKFEGTPDTSKSPSSLSYQSDNNLKSTIFSGYILAPASGVVRLGLGEPTRYFVIQVTVLIENSKVYEFKHTKTSTYTLPYNFEAGRLYYTTIKISTTVTNIEGTRKYILNWSILNPSTPIPDSNLYYPTRISSMPYMLSSLNYDTYCDDIAGFSCILCDIPLCSECEHIKSPKQCKICGTHSHLDGGICTCDDGFYVKSQDPRSCVSCPEHCGACKELNGTVECINLEPEDCSICPDSLCKECNEKNGVCECLSCKNPHKLDNDGKCICDEEDYQISGGECEPKEFILYLNSTVNTIQLEFSKILLKELEFSELGYQKNSILEYLSLNFIIVENKKKYSILYHSKIDVDTNFSVTLSLSDVVKDRQYQSLLNLDYGVQVPILFQNITQYTKENTQSTTFKSMKSNSRNGAIAVVATGAVSSLINMRFTSLWVLLNTLEIFSYIPLLNIDIPDRVKAVASGMSLDLVPNLIESHYPQVSNNTPERYSDLGLNSSQFIFNNLKLMIILASFFCLYLVFKALNQIVKNRSRKIEGYLYKAISKCEWSVFLRFSIQNYLVLAITSSLALLYVIYI